MRLFFGRGGLGEEVLRRAETLASITLSDPKRNLRYNLSALLNWDISRRWGEIRSYLSTILPGFERVDNPQDYTPTPRRFSGDLAGMLTLKDIWMEDTLDLVPSPLSATVAELSKPRLVIFGDSFTWALLPFAKRDFSHIRFDRPTPKCVDFKSVAEEKPAVVIWLIVERDQETLRCSPLNMPEQP
jgi:hypothetical protein